MKYMVIIEKGPESWGAYVPDLPGCVAAGESRDEVIQLIKEAMDFHLEGLKAESTRVLADPLGASERFSHALGTKP